MRSFNPIESGRQHIGQNDVLLLLLADREPSKSPSHLDGFLHAVGKCFTIGSIGEVHMCSNVPKVADSWDLESIFIPSVLG